MGIKKTGDWARVKNFIRNLNGELSGAQDDWITRVTLYAEAQAVKHISTQDLRWTPLKPATIAAKVRKGQSEDIYVATSTYFQSITSYAKNGKGYVGVNKTATYADGMKVSDIAKLMEFGGGSMPARPLWQPTFKEALAWGSTKGPGSIIKILKNRFSKY